MRLKEDTSISELKIILLINSNYICCYGASGAEPRDRFACYVLNVRNMWSTSTPRDYHRVLTAHIHGKERTFTCTLNSVSWKMGVKWLEQIMNMSFLLCSWAQGLFMQMGRKSLRLGPFGKYKHIRVYLWKGESYKGWDIFGDIWLLIYWSWRNLAKPLSTVNRQMHFYIIKH
jgi:hypothetical protein